MKKIIVFFMTMSILALSSITSFAASNVSLSKDGVEYTPIRYSFTNYNSKITYNNGNKYHASIFYAPKGAVVSNNGVDSINEFDQIGITVYDDTDIGRGVRLRWYPNGEIAVLGYQFKAIRNSVGNVSAVFDLADSYNIGYSLKEKNDIFVAVPDPVSRGGRVFVTNEIIKEIERFLYPQADDIYSDAYDKDRLDFLTEMRHSIYLSVN